MNKFEMPCDCGVCDECIAKKENLHIGTDKFEKIPNKKSISKPEIHTKRDDKKRDEYILN